MTDTETPQSPSPLEPCRKKISRKRMKQALGMFIGTCGTAAAATVVSVAVNRMSLAAGPASQPSSIPAEVTRLAGDVAPIRLCPTQPSQPATIPASDPADIDARPVRLPGKLSSVRLGTTQPTTMPVPLPGVPPLNRIPPTAPAPK